MSDKTKIEWTDATWNPVTGCDKVTPGCDHCYAETIANRFAGTPAYPDGFAVTLRPERLDQPLRWTRPRRVFVNSMSDLFHKDVPDHFIAEVFGVMAASFMHDRPTHTFQVLTKRHGRMRSLLSSPDFRASVAAAAAGCTDEDHADAVHDAIAANYWPLPNVWLGVSVEDQQRADLRIPALLDTPAAVRFLSCEPLLGRVTLPKFCACGCGETFEAARRSASLNPGWLNSEQAAAGVKATLGIDWVIVGGESGSAARPMHPEWARSLRDQCQAAGIAFHFKQWGEWAPDEWIDDDGFRHVGRKPDPKDPKSLVMHPAGMTALTPRNTFDPWDVGHPDWHTVMRRVGKKAAGRELDGRTWDEFPEVTP